MSPQLDGVYCPPRRNGYGSSVDTGHVHDRMSIKKLGSKTLCPEPSDVNYGCKIPATGSGHFCLRQGVGLWEIFSLHLPDFLQCHRCEKYDINLRSQKEETMAGLRGVEIELLTL